jgi:hypothetical protein
MRIQLELPDAKVQELKDLMASAEIGSYKELFNNSLTLLEWAVDQVKAGRVIASVDEDNEKYRVLLMPVLQTIAKKSQEREHTQAAHARSLVLANP